MVAARAHDGQFRKSTDVPYIIHPFSVALIVSEYTEDEDVIIAALFHDIIEDVSSTVYSKEQMKEEFGQKVVDLVLGASEDKTGDEPEGPWEMRKKEFLERLAANPNQEAILISAADKLHNATSIVDDYALVGDELWSRFGAGASSQLWYYQTVSEIISNKLGQTHGLAIKLAKKVKALDQLVVS